MKKTVLKQALDDIKSYRTFSELIEINFVIALFENVYLDLENKQMIEIYMEGFKGNYERPEEFIENNYEKNK